jgi:hypothetical protein
MMGTKEVRVDTRLDAAAVDDARRRLDALAVSIVSGAIRAACQRRAKRNTDLIDSGPDKRERV